MNAWRPDHNRKGRRLGESPTAVRKIATGAADVKRRTVRRQTPGLIVVVRVDKLFVTITLQDLMRTQVSRNCGVGTSLLHKLS